MSLYNHRAPDHFPYGTPQETVLGIILIIGVIALTAYLILSNF